MVLAHHFNTWIWLAFGILFSILEYLITTSGFLILLGVIAIIISCLLWLFPTLLWPYQLLIFSVTGIIGSVSWWTYLLRYPTATKLRQQLGSYENRVFTLDEPIIHGKGVLPIDDMIWLITGPDLPIGTKVRIISIKNSILRVHKVE